MNGQNLNANQNRQGAQQNENYAEPASPEATRIGFSTPDINDRFLRYLEIAARIHAEQNNADIVLADAQNDQQTQYRQIENMIRNEDLQGLIVIPVNTDAMQPVTDMAKEAQIPLVYLNRKPFPANEVPPNVYYVGSDPQDAGIKQADFLGENLIVGNLGILMGIPGLEATVGRTEGLEQELSSKFPGIQVIVKGYADFLRQPAYNLVKQWLQQYGYNLNAIAANNDEMALGAIRALQEAGRNDVMVVGVDALRQGREAVRQGLLAATVFQDANVQGETAIDLVQQLIQGQTPAQQIVMIPHILITDGAQNIATP